MSGMRTEGNALVDGRYGFVAFLRALSPPAPQPKAELIWHCLLLTGLLLYTRRHPYVRNSQHGRL